MEGNNCYKYRNLKCFIKETGADPVLSVIEIGTNIGKVTAEIAGCFPDAKIVTYEMIKEYRDAATILLARYKNVEVREEAICAKHLFEDDFGQKPRKSKMEMHAFFAVPNERGLHLGGSLVSMAGDRRDPNRYKERPESLKCLTLDEAMHIFLLAKNKKTIDYIKSDAEGAENNFLGCASQETLEKIRYMAGEYHNFRRFLPVAQKLMKTHFVNLSGHPSLGSFFFERKTDKETMLVKIPTPNIPIKSISIEPVYWNAFDERWK